MYEICCFKDESGCKLKRLGDISWKIKGKKMWINFQADLLNTQFISSVPSCLECVSWMYFSTSNDLQIYAKHETNVLKSSSIPLYIPLSSICKRNSIYEWPLLRSVLEWMLYEPLLAFLYLSKNDTVDGQVFWSIRLGREPVNKKLWVSCRKAQ